MNGAAILTRGVLLLTALLGALDDEPVPERRLPDEATREDVYDTAWILPVPDAERHLATRLQRLAVLRFDDGAAEPAPADGTADPRPAADGDATDDTQSSADRSAPPPGWTRSFGDLVAAFGERRRDPAAVDALLARLEREHPDVWARVSDTLPALVRSSRLYGDDWDPDDKLPRDGFLHVEPWSLADRDERPWRDLEGSRDVHQAATLAWSDPRTLKVVENDFSAYLRRKGSSYLEVGAVPGSVVRGADERGPFASLEIRSRSDLPFPFGSYTSVVDVLCVPGEGGTLVTHVVSRSPDFHWLAGRDHWIPVRDADGALVATLLVRELGFDLDGVPDGDGARRAAIRSALGNLKRDAEARGLDRDAVFTPLPDYPVRGRP